jgi:hypothetical protein
MTVLFIDGSAQRYSTTANRSCKNIIDFLNEKYKYPKLIYKILLQKAQKIDIDLEKNSPQ